MPTSTNCATCRESKAAPVPFIAYEAQMVRMDNQLHRSRRTLLIVIAVALIALVVCNLAWLHAWQSYDYISEADSVEIEARDGTAYYIGGDGNNYNGDYTSNEKTPDTPQN